VKGGVEKRIHEVSGRLVERGHEVHVDGMRSRDGPAVIERDGVVLHGVCPGEALYAGGRRGIAQALWFGASVLRPFHSSGADVIDCQNFPYFSCFSAKAASVVRGVPLVVTWHEVWGDYWYDYLGRRAYGSPRRGLALDGPGTLGSRGGRPGPGDPERDRSRKHRRGHSAGGLVGLGIIRGWAVSGFGSLFQIANAVWALALFLAGMQVVFSGIFTSMVLLNRGEEQE